MKEPSFWETETFNQPNNLIVIGAGIVGLSSALFYRQLQPDARILVIDRGPIPEGASTRNAGFACVGSITEHLADMGKEAEENIKKRLKRRYDGLQLLRKTLGDEAINYENCGGYELFTDSDTFALASGNIDRFNKWMESLIGQENVYQPEKLNGYDVIYNRLEGALHPGKMMHSLIEKVASAGISIRWNTKVDKILDSGVLALESGTKLHTSQILVACNAFTKRLLPEISIQPRRGQVLVSEPWENMPWKGTFSFDRGYIYFRHVGNRLLLGGGRNMALDEETSDEFGSNEKVRSYLCSFAREVLKMPDSVSFEYEWSGIMGFTPTKTPIVERINLNCVVAAGLSGMGIAIGMDVGQTAAGILNDK